jgi:hypothetical protein
VSTEKTELIPAAHYLPACTRGRPTLYRKFLEVQSDMFPSELMAAHYGTGAPSVAGSRAAGARAATVAAAIPPATNRGGKVKTDRERIERETRQYLEFIEGAFCDE